MSANAPVLDNTTPFSRQVLLSIPSWLKYAVTFRCPSNYNGLSVTCWMRGSFIIIYIRNAGPVEDKRTKVFCSSYHCTFGKCSRSNTVLTLQSVSPLWIFQPCRVRALWSIQSRILLETENSVLANRRFTKLHHGSYHTQWETCQAFLCKSLHSFWRHLTQLMHFPATFQCQATE